jgi:cysteine desulfurase family protein (TIGR01976 family)
MAFDIETVRAQFPALGITDNGKRRIYFDNPAGTQVPELVIERMRYCLVEANANRGGQFATSRAADAVVDDAHAAMAEFLNAPSADEIIFGQNMTTLTIYLSRSIGRALRPGDEIVLSQMDHDANVEPWLLMARDFDLVVRWLPFNTETCEFEADALDQVLTERTRLVCVGGASNLLGTLNDIESICRKAREAGAWSYIDAVQSVPHVVTDVQRIGCDFLACSAYKFFGPHQGIVYGRREVLESLSPYKVRPASDSPPGCFETGTQSHEGMAGTAAAVDYFAWIGSEMAGASGDRQSRAQAGMSLLVDYEKNLSERLIDGLKSIEGVSVHGITSRDAYDRRVPTVVFTHKRMAPAEIAARLGEDNIFVWSGHNYAIEPAKALGLLETGGAVRVGPVHYNRIDEIDELIESLGRILGS